MKKRVMKIVCFVDQQSVRQRLLDKLLAHDIPALPWISALALGYRGLLEKEDWQVVQRSGIAHLIAISGLHLALVASLSYAVFSRIFALLAQIFFPSQAFNFS